MIRLCDFNVRISFTFYSYRTFSGQFVIPELKTLPSFFKQAVLHRKFLLKSRLNFAHHALTLLACLLLCHLPRAERLTSQDQTQSNLAHLLYQTQSNLVQLFLLSLFSLYCQFTYCYRQPQFQVLGELIVFDTILHSQLIKLFRFFRSTFTFGPFGHYQSPFGPPPLLSLVLPDSRLTDFYEIKVFCTQRFCLFYSILQLLGTALQRFRETFHCSIVSRIGRTLTLVSEVSLRRKRTQEK